MSAGPPRQRGKAPSWFQARLVEGEASPLRGSAVSAASSRSSHPGETIVPLSSSTSVSARVAAASRFRQAAAPAGASVADCGTSPSCASAARVASSGPSGSSSSDTPGGVCASSAASVARRRSGSACTATPMATSPAAAAISAGSGGAPTAAGERAA